MSISHSFNFLGLWICSLFLSSFLFLCVCVFVVVAFLPTVTAPLFASLSDHALLLVIWAYVTASVIGMFQRVKPFQTFFLLQTLCRMVRDKFMAGNGEKLIVDLLTVLLLPQIVVLLAVFTWDCFVSFFCNFLTNSRFCRCVCEVIFFFFWFVPCRVRSYFLCVCLWRLFFVPSHVVEAIEGTSEYVKHSCTMKSLKEKRKREKTRVNSWGNSERLHVYL